MLLTSFADVGAEPVDENEETAGEKETTQVPAHQRMNRRRVLSVDLERVEVIHDHH